MPLSPIAGKTSMNSPAKKTTPSLLQPGQHVFQVRFKEQQLCLMIAFFSSAKYCPSPADYETEDIKCTTVIF